MTGPSTSLRFLRALSTAGARRCDVVAAELIGKRSARLTFRDGRFRDLSALWLRENATDADSFNTATQQRAVDSLALHTQQISLDTIDLRADGSVAVVVGNVQTVYTREWLAEHAYRKQFSARPVRERTALWGTDGAAEELPRFDWHELVHSDVQSGVRASLFSAVDAHGAATVTNVPVSEEATQCAIETLGVIRNTQWGTLWSFGPDLAHGDTAYTNERLAAHTDGTYFSQSPRLQCFHALRANVEGGETLLVDGFAAAARVRSQNPHLFHLLSQHPIRCHYDDDTDAYETVEPVLRLSPGGDELVQIRFNNDDRSPLDLDEPLLSEFEDAYMSLAREIRRPEAERWVKLEPGTLLIIDNWRVLHGRSAFAGSDRLMCGAYVSHDDYMSRRHIALHRALADQ